MADMYGHCASPRVESTCSQGLEKKKNLNFSLPIGQMLAQDKSMYTLLMFYLADNLPGLLPAEQVRM